MGGRSLSINGGFERSLDSLKVWQKDNTDLMISCTKTQECQGLTVGLLQTTDFILKQAVNNTLSLYCAGNMACMGLSYVCVCVCGFLCCFCFGGAVFFTYVYNLCNHTHRHTDT